MPDRTASDPRAARRSRAWLAAIIIAYLLLATATSFVVPLGEVPDELDHFHYTQYLVQERSFPVMRPDPAANTTMEANQPPLYYLLGAAAAGWLGLEEPLDLAENICYSFDADDAGRQTFYLHTAAETPPYTPTVLGFHLVRLLSVLMGGATVLLAYVLARQVVPRHAPVAVLAAAFVAFNPQFIFINAGVTNDVLTALLGGVIITSAVAAWRRQDGFIFLMLGLAIGLGLLTKFALLALWPLALLAAGRPLIESLFGRRSSTAEPGQDWRAALRQSLLNGSPLFLLPLLLAGPWYWRAYRLYGDPLVWDVHLAAKGAEVLRVGPLGWADLGEFLQLHFRSYWALFGWLNVQAPGWVYGILAMLVGLGLVGLGCALASAWRAKRVPDAERLVCFRLPALLLSLLAVAAVYAALLRYIQTINWSGYQGRLAYAAVAPVAVLLAVGFGFLAQRVAGRWRGWILSVPAAVLLLLAVWSLVFLLPNAYPRPQVYQTPPVQVASCTRFAPGLQIEGIEVPPRVTVGETLPVTIYGYGLEDAPGPHVLVVQLTGRDGGVVGETRTPLAWEAGEPVAIDLVLPVANTEPARGVITVGLQDKGGAWVGATSINQRDLEVPVALETTKLAPVLVAQAQPARTTDAVFGERLALSGYDLVSEGVLRLHWQARAPMDADYTTFVHLLNVNGELVAQADGQPQGGAYPTSIWDVGEVVVDEKMLALPDDAGADPYRLLVGVYDLSTGARLLLDDASGADSFLLATCHTPAACFAEHAPEAAELGSS